MLTRSARSSSTASTSMSERLLPSESVSSASLSETSPLDFFMERKYMRISFSAQRAAYVARRTPLSGR